MSAGGHHVDGKFIHSCLHMSIGLYCIRMEQNAVLSGNFSDLLNRLNRSDLIICKHHRDQDRIRTDCLFQLIQFKYPIFIYINIGNGKSSFFQIFAGMQNRMMLDLRGNNVLSFALISLCSRN